MQSLVQKYVPVAEELHNLRTGKTPEAKFFQNVFQQTKKHPGHQGVFLATPSGRLLASSTCYEPEKVIELLNKGYRAWQDLPTKVRLVPKSDLIEITHGDRPEDDYPADGLVLRVTARDLPKASLEQQRTARWHRYYLWFNREEAQSMLPKQLEAGQQQGVPDQLTRRIASLALLDKGIVDGYTRPFRDSEVEIAELQLQVMDVTENRVRLQIIGRTKSRTSDAEAFVRNMPKYDNIPEYRGVETAIVGKAIYDTIDRRFVDFQMIAVGNRIGGAYVGRPPDDWAASPLGFSFTLGRPNWRNASAPNFPSDILGCKFNENHPLNGHNGADPREASGCPTSIYYERGVAKGQVSNGKGTSAEVMPEWRLHKIVFSPRFE